MVAMPASVGRSVLVAQYYANTSKGRITDYTAKGVSFPAIYSHEVR